MSVFILIKKSGTSSLKKLLDSHKVDYDYYGTGNKAKVTLVEPICSDVYYPTSERHYAIVRHPLSRFISGWNFAKRLGIWIRQDLTPFELLKMYANEPETLVEGLRNHLKPQSSQLYRLKSVTLLPIETIGKNLDVLSKALGVKVTEFPECHRSNYDRYILEAQFYQLFAKVYAEDFRILPYSATGLGGLTDRS